MLDMGAAHDAGSAAHRAQTSDEIEALAMDTLGPFAALARKPLSSVADRLRPGERVTTLAVGSGGLAGGQWFLAATDQRLLLIGDRSTHEDVEYDTLVSMTVDAPAGAIALVTDTVRTLRLSPAASAAQIGALVAARIGSDRIHEAAGAAEARRMSGALFGAILTICIVVGVWALRTDFTPNDRPAAPAPAALVAGQCLDLSGVDVSCRSSRALFVVSRRRTAARPCPRGDDAHELLSDVAQPRDVAGWCIAFTSGGGR